jgi:two-component system cell cycle sensor histidine kinase PleC
MMSPAMPTPDALRRSLRTALALGVAPALAVGLALRSRAAVGLALAAAALGWWLAGALAAAVAGEVAAAAARLRAMAAGTAEAGGAPGDGALHGAVDAWGRRFAEERARHREALTRLEETERRREAWLATLRHELRTPLNAIVGFTELLAAEVEGPLTDAQREDVDTIGNAGGHLRSLVEDVFDLSAMTTGTFPVTRVRANVAAVVRDVVREAEGLARTRGVSLRWEGPAEAEAWVDAVAIRRALTNLVVNAIEHAGGAVAVTLAASAATLTVAVRDNGPGIAPGELKRLFRPFERGRTAEARGAGLGLAITLGLVEMHGGTLSAHANDDRGSTFTVTLPAGMVPLEAEA